MAFFDMRKGMKVATAAKKYDDPRSTLKTKNERKYTKNSIGSEPTLRFKIEELVTWITE